MAQCECLPACPFFHDKIVSPDGLGAMYKQRYCLGDKSQCARYMVFTKLGKGNVPRDLFPNQVDKARKLVG
jgi:hypothetical protein